MPILDHLDNRFQFKSLYRASFVYESSTDRLRTIVSAKDTAWGMLSVVHDYAALRRALDASRTAAAASLVASRDLVRGPAPSGQRIVLNARP